MKKLARKVITVVWLGVLACAAVPASGIYAQPPIVNEATLMGILPDSHNIKEVTHSSLDGRYQFFVGEKDGRIVGYAVMDTVNGKNGPIQYVFSLDKDGKVRNVVLLEHSERMGGPSTIRRFLRQFKGKDVRNKLRLKQDVHAVTGATVSSRSITDGIREAVHVFNEIYVNNGQDRPESI